MAEAERALLERPADYTPPGVIVRATPRMSCSSATRSSSPRESRSRRSRFPGTRPPTSPSRRTGRCSRATCSSPARSAAPTSRARAGRRCARRSRRCSTGFRLETVVYPGHGPATTLGQELDTNPFLAELRAARSREDRGAAGHARHPPGRPAAVAARCRRGGAPLRALRLPAHPDPGVRGHRPLRADVRRAGSDVVQKEMYTFEDRGGRSLTLRPEATAPICRAYVEHGLPARAAAAEAVHGRDDVPVRAPAEGRYREHWQFSRRGDRLGRPGARRRADPALRHAARSLGVSGLPARAELDRRRRVPARVPRAAARLARRPRRRARRGHARASATRARCGSSTTSKAKPPARARSRRRPDDRRVALRAVPGALRRRAAPTRRLRRSLRARPDPRARARLLHAHDLGVRGPAARRAEHDPGGGALRRSRRGDRRARRRRASASAPASSGSCWRSRRPPRRSPRRHDVFFAIERRRARRAGWRSSNGRLRAAAWPATPTTPALARRDSSRRPPVWGPPARCSCRPGRPSRARAGEPDDGRRSVRLRARRLSEALALSPAHHRGATSCAARSGPSTSAGACALAGWVDAPRDHGGLVFVDLRDRSGRASSSSTPSARRRRPRRPRPRNEFVLRPRARSSRDARGGQPEPADGRGGAAGRPARDRLALDPLPFQLDEEDVDETLRLRYRWLDLRRPEAPAQHRAAGADGRDHPPRDGGPPASSTSRRRSSSSRRPRARATSSCRARCSRAVSTRCRRARRS